MPYTEHPLPPQQQQPQQPLTRFSFGPQYPEAGPIGEYYGPQEKQAQAPQRQGSYQQDYPGEYSVKPMDHLVRQQGYVGVGVREQHQQGYVEQTWTQASDGAYWSPYEHPVQQPRYQE